MISPIAGLRSALAKKRMQSRIVNQCDVGAKLKIEFASLLEMVIYHVRPCSINCTNVAMIKSDQENYSVDKKKLPQYQDSFFYLFASCVGKAFRIARDYETTFFQHPNRGTIVPGSGGIKRAFCHDLQERRKRLGRDAPILPTNPVTDVLR